MMYTVVVVVVGIYERYEMHCFPLELSIVVENNEEKVEFLRDVFVRLVNHITDVEQEEEDYYYYYWY